MSETELPLESLERLLNPIRRVVSFGADHPLQVRYLETNLDRFLQPLLAHPLPDALREHTLTLAGQVSGFDSALDKPERLTVMRDQIRQLDQVLGLPLPVTVRARRKMKIRQQPERPTAPAEPTPAKQERTRESRRGRGRDKGAPREAKAARDSQEPKRAAPRAPRGWNGDLSAPLSGMHLPGDLATRFEAAGLHSAGDLLMRGPTSTEELSIEGAGRDLEAGRAAVGGRRVSAWTRVTPSGDRWTKAILRGAGDTVLRWEDPELASAWLRDVHSEAKTVALGSWDEEELVDAVSVSGEGQTVVLGSYGIAGVRDAEVRLTLSRLLPMLDRIRDPLPPAYRSEQLAFAEAITTIHRGQQGASARLAWDEALVYALVTGLVGTGTERKRGIAHTLLHGPVAQLLEAADTGLDDAQEMVLDGIKRDLRSTRPMRRMVIGEPGGGKGLVALCAATIVAASKCQVAFVSSDPVDLEQRFAFAEPLLTAAGIECRKIDGMGPADRAALKKGEIGVVFGGPELVDAQVEYRRLGLVIATGDSSDVSRPVSVRKAPTPDILAVPTMSLSTAALLAGWPAYALSTLAGSTRPNVLVKPSSQRVSAYAQARHALLDKKQVAVLFPLIEHKDALEPAEASRVMNALGEDALPGVRLSLYHGAMGREERWKAYQDFRHRRTDALLATTAVEESAPVPGLEVVVVEHAQKMSRERLSRLAGLGVSHVSLVVADDTPESTVERLRDAVVNGWCAPYPSDGLPQTEHLDLTSDTPEVRQMVLAARNLAMEILSSDALLRSGTHAGLCRMARARWAEWGTGECPLAEAGEQAGANKRRRRRRRR